VFTDKESYVLNLHQHDFLKSAAIAVKGLSVAGKMNAGRMNLRGTKVNFCEVLVLLCCVFPRTPGQ